MKTRKQIPHNVICLTVTAIALSLLMSCSAVMEVGEAPKDNNIAISSEINLEEQPATISTTQEPQHLVEKDFSEDNAFETFVNNGLELQYPSEWSLFDVTDKRAWIEDAFAIFEIKRSEDVVNFRIVVQIYSDIPDGGFEKRKEEANQFFENALSATTVSFYKNQWS